ncbi:hypothetical protein HYX19_00210 [Candidatus Woesearchaeota archaeon]|nr:hypothetical protein [Candidatus Woesearchaeota archaeon]
MADEKYNGMEICGMEVPYVRLMESNEGLKSSDIAILFRDRIHELPDNLAGYKEKVVSEKEEAAKKAGKSFFDGQLVRLDTLEFLEGKLELTLSGTSFFRFSCSNHALGIRFGDRNVRETYVDETLLEELTDQLANPIGVELGLITSDNKVPIMLRSTNLSQYPGLYGVPAGFMDRVKDRARVEMIHDKYGKFLMPDSVSPFITMAREFAEEILGQAKNDDSLYNIAFESAIRNMKLLGIGRAYDDLHLEFIMTSKTDAPSDYLIENSKFAPDKFEYQGKPIMVDFNPRALAQYLVKRVSVRPKGTPDIANIWIDNSSPQWVPAHWMTIYYMLAKEFGKDEVHKELFKELGGKDETR